MDGASLPNSRPDRAGTLGERTPDRPAGLACARDPKPGGDVSHGRTLARLLVDALQPFLVADFSGRITCVNHAFAALVGAPAADLIGSPLALVAPERWRRAQARALARLRTSGTSLRFEAECRRRDGQVIPIDAAVEPDRGPDGAPVGLFAFVTDLSGRRAVENALRASEERFRSLYDNAPVGYHEVDAEGRIVNINRTECEFLGYPRDALVGRPVFDLLAEETRAAAREAFPEKVSGTRPLRTIERTVVTRGGDRLCVSIEECYRLDENGRIIGLLSTVQDVTDRKRTEAALRASERRARALFEGIEDAVFVHAFDGQILDANPAASRLLGYSHEELLALTTADVEAPGVAAGDGQPLSCQVAAGPLRREGRHRTKDGRVIPVEINSSTIQFDDQKAVLAVVTDISERLALEETRRAFAASREANARAMAAKNAELTLSEARYRQLTEGCLDGVVVADREGRVTLLNPAAGRTFGYEPSEVIGRPIGLLLPALEPAPGHTFEEDVLGRTPGLVGQTAEFVGRRKSGEEFPLELSLSAVTPDGDVQFIGSIRDQTERHRMRAVLARSERLASIGLMSAGVAHEINNPLAYVANNLAVLERDLNGVVALIAAFEEGVPCLEAHEPDVLCRVRAAAEDLDWDYVRENLPRMFTRTREGIQRVATIVSNLRLLARTSPTKMESVRVDELVEAALEMVRVRLRRHHIEISTEHGAIPELTCEPTQISQVLLNLLVNACQAVESSGRTEGGRIVFSSALEGEAVVLSVRDNGPGIAPEVLPHLFDPFFTTKEVGEGTGLGLSICHSLITGHGGRIEVDSRPGSGATFRVVLPLTTA